MQDQNDMTLTACRVKLRVVRGRWSRSQPRMSGVRCQVSGVRCQVSGVRCQVSGVRCQVSEGQRADGHSPSAHTGMRHRRGAVLLLSAESIGTTELIWTPLQRGFAGARGTRVSDTKRCVATGPSRMLNARSAKKGPGSGTCIHDRPSHGYCDSLTVGGPELESRLLFTQASHLITGDVPHATVRCSTDLIAAFDR